MCKIGFFVTLIVLSLVLSRPVAQADSLPANDLFGEFTGMAAYLDSGKADPTVVRRRPVYVHSHMVSLSQGSQEDALPSDFVNLNLFPDISYTAVFDRLETNPSGSQSWIGHIPDQPMSQVILVSQDGLMAGNISMPGAFYQVRYEGDGVHTIREIDQSKFPDNDDVVVPDNLAESQPDTESMKDDGSTVDVLVVYTPAASKAVGGTSAMNTLIDLAITETNAAYQNSGVNHRLRLVHKAEVKYTEQGFSAALNHITSKTDGNMDEVHALRDQYGADEVVLIINDASSCGVAWLMTTVSTSFESKAFAVAHHSCATGYYSFAHEIGHNMGARHDRHMDTTNTPYDTSHGYVNVTGKWRTIMAYDDKCAAAGTRCTRVQYWSNPGINYKNSPMGVASGSAEAADNHATLNKTSPTVANFRNSVSGATTTTSSSCTSGTSYKATLSNGSIGSLCLSVKKVSVPSGESKLRGTATWKGFAKTAESANGSTFSFAWENFESNSATGLLYENNPAQGALFILAFAFPGSSCSGGASFFAVIEAPSAVSMTDLGSTIKITPLFGQICGSKITSLTQHTLTKQ